MNPLELYTNLPDFGKVILDATPLGGPLRLAGQVMGPKAGERKTVNGKPYIYDAQRRTYIPDQTTIEGKNAWRKEGTRATKGGQPVVWDSRSQTYIPDFSRPPARDPITRASEGQTGGVQTGEDPPPAPELPSPELPAPPTTSTEGTPLGDQKPPYELPELIDAVRDIFREDFLPYRQAELQAELKRSVVTAALRDRGLKELSRRQIETENIRAWKDLQVAREQARAAQAISLANTAYLAQIPNTGVMEAMNNAMKSAMQQITVQAPTTPTGRNLFG